VAGIEKLAEAGALEVVSLAPDQTSQELLAKFIRGEEDPSKYLAGQGGAPIRTVEDLRRLKAATRRGNHPLSRIYTGTDELVELAKLYESTLNMAVPAVPIVFYHQIDGRGPISIRDSFDEHYSTIRWWAEAGKYNVLPLDDRMSERFDATLRPNPLAGLKKFSYGPGVTGISESAVLNTHNVPFTVTADIEVGDAGGEGVLAAIDEEAAV
jgi:hypothetical protein